MSVALESIAAARESDQQVAGTPVAERKIVLLDDAADAFAFAVIALEQAGYRTELKRNFHEFTREFELGGCEGIIVDVHLGENDAIDVLDFLKRENCTAPIFLMSGDPDGLTNASRYAEEIGIHVAACFSKPFTASRLVERIRSTGSTTANSPWDIDVDEALRKQWIYPVLQPKLHLASGEIRSAELLSRMAHPRLGTVTPGRFIGGMNSRQSQLLFLQQLAFVRRQFKSGQPAWRDLQVSVNVDPENLAHLRTRIREIVDTAPDFHRNLILEITEEKLSVIDDDQLKALYKMCLEGARFSIDDFGVGLSNFARLSRLPFHELKIDRSIVHGCALASARRIMIKSIINMAHELGAMVVAEGVEQLEDLKFLEENGCDAVQGYLIAKPMETDSFCSFVSGFNKPASPTPAGKFHAFLQSYSHERASPAPAEARKLHCTPAATR